jgi:FkbM family methyltransferase
MSFHSQNFEDVLLARCFESGDRGFYVDVGAEDPDIGSVTRYFYEQGWRGLNVEPVPDFHRRLQQRRPRDLNVAVAASDRDGLEVELTVVPGTGLSSLAPRPGGVPEPAGGASEATHRIRVRTARLDTLLAWARLPRIDFLKVDVEGHERAVLEGLDLAVHRPRLIVIETTDPLVYDGGWVPLSERPGPSADSEVLHRHLQARGYVEVHFDGLNSWWIAEEAPELAPAFVSPPNVFDGTGPMVERALERTLQNALGREQRILEELRVARLELEGQEQTIEQLKHERQALATQLEQLHGSFSWKLTSPYRRIADRLRG